MIFFDFGKGRYEVRDVPSNGKPKPFDRNLPVNQSLCLKCHSQNPKPIFHDYNAWPGFYGSFSQESYAVKVLYRVHFI